MKIFKMAVLMAILPLLPLNSNAQQTWDGSADSDWENDANWTPGPLAPDYSEDVTIPSGMPNDPVIQSAPASPVECNNLTIDAGATLTIQLDGGLNIYGDADNSGDIIITGNGIFWQDFGTTYTAQPGSTFTLSRTGISNVLKFNMWSSPVAAQSVGAFSGNAYSFNPATSTTSAADDDNDPGWATAAGNMTVGRGYACAGCGTVTFTGTPNNGNLSVTVQYNNPANPTGVPYNLIGNPYPSPLDISEFLAFGSNPSDLATIAVYFWDSQTPEPFSISDYATVNDLGTVSSGTGAGTYSTPYDFITTGQGFFVDIDPGTDGDMDFSNSIRADGFDDNSKFYKQADKQRLWLGVTDADSTVYNELLVAFTDSATSGFDKKYDAKKLIGNTKLSLYSINNDLHYAIQGLPYLAEEETEVPVGVSLDTAKTITFSLKWEELLENFDIYLDDNLTGTLTNLRDENYTLSLAAGEHNGRFSLRFTLKTTGIENVEKADLIISYSSGNLTIGNAGNDLRNIESVSIFDLSGKRIKSWTSLSIKENLSLPFNAVNPGYYLVKVVSGRNEFQEKIYVTN